MLSMHQTLSTFHTLRLIFTTSIWSSYCPYLHLQKRRLRVHHLPRLQNSQGERPALWSRRDTCRLILIKSEVRSMYHFPATIPGRRRLRESVRDPKNQGQEGFKSSERTLILSSSHSPTQLTGSSYSIINRHMHSTVSIVGWENVSCFCLLKANAASIMDLEVRFFLWG